MNQPDRIIAVVEDYLTMNTEYALLITGEWGSGKTFYFNNILKDNIQKVKVGSGKKSFKILYLSLFGLNSIAEIQQLMFLELFPLFKTKTAKIGGAALKIIMTGVTNLISKNNFSHNPLFTFEILPSFLESFECMNNKELYDFFDFLYERYSKKRNVDIESDFLKQFSEILGNNIAEENRKIRRWHLVHLKSLIDKRLQEEMQ